MSNFVDYVKIHCQSGHGGAGSAHLRREKYIAKGGPDGGDGGRGGHVIMKGNAQEWTLLPLRYTRHIKAENGQPGGMAAVWRRLRSVSGLRSAGPAGLLPSGPVPGLPVRRATGEEDGPHHRHHRSRPGRAHCRRRRNLVVRVQRRLFRRRSCPEHPEHRSTFRRRKPVEAARGHQPLAAARGHQPLAAARGHQPFRTWRRL